MYIRIDINELDSNLPALEEQCRQAQRLKECIKQAQRISSGGCASQYRRALEYANTLLAISDGLYRAMNEGVDTFCICAICIEKQLEEAHVMLDTLDS